MADLSDSYGAKIYQLAFRYLRNREDAEEVAQDVLLKVYQKIDAFRGDAALSSWIYRITFNAAMSRLREFKQNLPNATEKASDDEEQPAAEAGGRRLVAARRRGNAARRKCGRRSCAR